MPHKRTNSKDKENSKVKGPEIFATKAVRSSKMPRFDLIPSCALIRLAKRATGHIDSFGNKIGGALQYGECNWMKGLPTSDVYNHIMNHLIKYGNELNNALNLYGDDMDNIRLYMRNVTNKDDELAGAMWGLMVLMFQEDTIMFHDDMYKPSR